MGCGHFMQTQIQHTVDFLFSGLNPSMSKIADVYNLQTQLSFRITDTDVRPCNFTQCVRLGFSGVCLYKNRLLLDGGLFQAISWGLTLNIVSTLLELTERFRTSAASSAPSPDGRVRNPGARLTYPAAPGVLARLSLSAVHVVELCR